MYSYEKSTVNLYCIPISSRIRKFLYGNYYKKINKYILSKLLNGKQNVLQWSRGNTPCTLSLLVPTVKSTTTTKKNKNNIKTILIFKIAR